MPRPIHHLVLPVTTLNLARGRLEALGFTVAADAAHPFGTGNCCVFFRNGTYLEPLTILDRNAADAAAANGVHFVRRAKRFMERQGEGFAMLALRTDDAEADAAAFEEAGFGESAPFRFSRPATLPDGSKQEIGVVLAFADDRHAPDATLFACEAINTEALWTATSTTHANGAVGVVAVAAVAADPSRFAALLSTAAGVEAAAVANGVGVEIGTSRIDILTPDGFRQRYGVDAPEPRRGLRLAGCEIAVEDVEVASKFAGASAQRNGAALVLPAGRGVPVAMMFSAAISSNG